MCFQNEEVIIIIILLYSAVYLSIRVLRHSRSCFSEHDIRHSAFQASQMDNWPSVRETLRSSDTLSYWNVSRVYFTRRFRHQITTSATHRVSCRLVLCYYSIFGRIAGTVQSLQGTLFNRQLGCLAFSMKLSNCLATAQPHIWLFLQKQLFFTN